MTIAKHRALIKSNRAAGDFLFAVCKNCGDQFGGPGESLPEAGEVAMTVLYLKTQDRGRFHYKDLANELQEIF
jgi:hypothetical protein